MSRNTWGERGSHTAYNSKRKLFFNEHAQKYELHPNSLANLRSGDGSHNAAKFAALCEAVGNLARAGVTSAPDIAMVTGASVAAIFRAKRRIKTVTRVTQADSISVDTLLS